MKDIKPKDITRLDRIIVFSVLVFPILFGAFVFIPIAEHQDNLEAIFLEQAEKDCRKINWYLEKDTVWRGHRLKQVFCWDSSGEKLLFKKPMKYD